MTASGKYPLPVPTHPPLIHHVAPARPRLPHDVTNFLRQPLPLFIEGLLILVLLFWYFATEFDRRKRNIGSILHPRCRRPLRAVDLIPLEQGHQDRHRHRRRLIVHPARPTEQGRKRPTAADHPRRRRPSEEDHPQAPRRT